jgi:chitosanase
MDAKPTIKKVLLAFEQGSTSIRYDKIYKYDDGPKDIKQITLSFGVTEFGNLHNFIKSYIFAGGAHAKFFTHYVDKIGRVSLVNDDAFVNKLKEAASDPIMQQCQEKAYEDMYISPAFGWAEKNGFSKNLSKLVICDSFLQSGSILSLLRNRFAEKVPKDGGDEENWIKEYVNARHNWLGNHSRKILQNTVYRMEFMKTRISLNDWDLNEFPMNANGVKITA